MKHHSFHPLAGVGLRSPHLDYFSQHKPDLSWLEIHSENYFQPNSAERLQLQSLREIYQISCHGIGLSLGSVNRVSRKHLAQLKALIDVIDPLFVSDHLSWSEHGGHYFNDLLPLPYTEEALNVFTRNVQEVQDYLQREILIENPSSYVKFQHSTINEWEFLVEVQQRTDCRLLLDLNNVYVSAFNHDFDCDTYLDAIPADKVDEIHLKNKRTGRLKVLKVKEFHIVCGLGDGSNSCSKNGLGPIEGPGPLDSFPPAVNPDHELHKKNDITPIYDDPKYYCCPSEENK